ncbi:MAG: alpha-galactosidase [Verrucomicrobiota bacterium]
MKFALGIVGALAAVGFVGSARAVSVTPDELAESRRWAAAKFEALPHQPLAEETGRTLFAAEPPFSFVYGGQPSAEWLKNRERKHTAEKLDDRRTRHTLAWTDPRTGLELRCVAIEYRNFPTVEWTLYFKNTGTNDTPILSDIQALELRLDRPTQGEFLLHHHKGDDCAPDSYEPRRLPLAPKSEHRFAPVGGRPTNQGFPYFNLEWPGAGLIIVVGWSGQWAAQFTRDGSNGLRVRAGQELTHFTLRPGEEVRTPLIVLQFWKGDRRRAQNVWRRWMLAHNLPRTRGGQLPPPIFTSCSGGFFPGLKCNEADELRFIDAFTGAGIKLDYWWMDAGWYPCGDGWPKVGTWTPDPVRFPRGLKAVSDRAHAKGMGLIVWFEPERVTPGTWLYEHHPEWLLGQDGDTKLLNLGDAAARQWLTDHVDAQLKEQGIDFYRQDFNMDPLPYWRAHDRADRQGITEIRHVEGYLAYWDELRRRRPGLIIDSCASGGRRNDLETLRRAVPLLRSDYQSFQGDPGYAPGNQGHTFGLSSWIPYYGQGAYYSDQQLVYSVRSHLSPAFGFCADVRKPGVDWPVIRRIAEQWRRVAPCFLGDFYPLTPYRLDNDVWMAWQFDLPEKGEGMVQVFRREHSAYEAARFPLHGLDASGRYAVMSLDEPSAQQELAGRELLESGLQVLLKEKPAAAIFFYKRAAAKP